MSLAYHRNCDPPKLMMVSVLCSIQASSPSPGCPTALCRKPESCAHGLTSFRRFRTRLSHNAGYLDLLHTAGTISRAQVSLCVPDYLTAGSQCRPSGGQPIQGTFCSGRARLAIARTVRLTSGMSGIATVKGHRHPMMNPSLTTLHPFRDAFSSSGLLRLCPPQPLA